MGNFGNEFKPGWDSFFFLCPVFVVTFVPYHSVELFLCFNRLVPKFKGPLLAMVLELYFKIQPITYVAVHSAVHFTNAALKQNKGGGKIQFGCYQWADKADQRKKQRRTLVSF